MEKKMETTVVYWGYITPIMENQMKKKMETEMETGVLYVFFSIPLGRTVTIPTTLSRTLNPAPETKSVFRLSCRRRKAFQKKALSSNPYALSPDLWALSGLIMPGWSPSQAATLELLGWSGAQVNGSAAVGLRV